MGEGNVRSGLSYTGWGRSPGLGPWPGLPEHRAAGRERVGPARAARPRRMARLMLPAWRGPALGPLLRPLCSWADGLLHSMAEPGTWDRFYTQQDTAGTPSHFNWFFDYMAISGLLLPALQGCGPPEPNPSPTRVLEVGCGTSDLSLGLYRDSPHPVHISCVDVSPVAIRSLHRLLQEVPPPRHPLSQLHLHVADATDLEGSGFGDGSFHLVLDKGTCDSLLRCAQGPSQARRLVAECLRVLCPGGSLLQFSDEDPDARVPFLEQAGAPGVTVQEVGHLGGMCYYTYKLCRPALETATTVALN